MEDYLFIMTPVAGWVIAQTLKILLDLRRNGVQLSDAIASGGMPSAHTAGIVALTTAIGIREGVQSAIFGLALTVMVVIIYDSLGVRRAAGENTLAIRKLQRLLKNKNGSHTLLARGHTPNEVLAGSLLGVAIGVIFASLL